MKFNLKGKGLIKTIALAVAGVAAITAVGFGVKAIVDYTKDDLKTISPSFEVGNLGSDGKFVDDKGTLYTKEAFACYGLQVKPDFDSTVNYQIFYYDILDNYISSTSVMSEGYSNEAPVNGAYARLVIEPKDDEDGKISLIERIKYSKQLSVKVKKNQDINNRFVNFKGRSMEVVYDTIDLVFKKDFSINHDTLTWERAPLNCITADTLLKVSGGSIFNSSYALLSEDYAEIVYTLFEFKGLPSNENFICRNNVASDISEFQLKKETRFIIISCYTQATAGWTDEVISKLPSCFTITKTK